MIMEQLCSAVGYGNLENSQRLAAARIYQNDSKANRAPGSGTSKEM
jgi:hypothetical protein